MHVADRLQGASDRSASLACVGLDPRPRLLPPALAAEDGDEGTPEERVAAAFLVFNRRILAAVAGSCACVKLQLACYEAYGAAGLRVCAATLAEAERLGIPVIVDGKRGDIGSTAAHYRQAYLAPAPDLAGRPIPAPRADWLTVNPYLGTDAIAPLLGNTPGDGGVFVLVRTSNPGAADLQDRPCADGTVMTAVADLVAHWGAGRTGACGLSDVGAVVGATWPDQARNLRARLPAAFFLVPGYGAQGAAAADALAGLRPDGRGIVVNSSRGIIGAWRDAGDGADWADAARGALDAMNADLNACR